MYKLEINNKNEMKIFGNKLSKYLRPGDVLSLNGDMGAGKTTLTQFIGEGLGIEDYITSPTFSIVQSYGDDPELHHIDLYRLEDSREIESIDADYYLYPEGITIIEWAVRAAEYMPRDIIEIMIKKVDDEKRVILIEGKNRKEKRVIEELSE